LTIDKREYNSERRRKRFESAKQDSYLSKNIRENITPRGDGNGLAGVLNGRGVKNIRENITPRGDGNHTNLILMFS